MDYDFISLMRNHARGFLGVLSLVCVSSAFAAPVGKAKAEAIAEQFVKSRQTNVDGRLREKAMPRLSQAKLNTTHADAYYVFNVGANDGYVVVSGDDRAVPILGYADKGHFDSDRMPDNMKAWLASYEQEITGIDANDFARAASKRASSVKNNVSVLLKSTWGQDAPFCDLAPDNMPSGCVATALGQILRYHKWPESTTTEIPAYTSGGNKYDALPVATFNWDVMADNYDNYYDKDSRAAVALLMEYLGRAVQMQYTPTGSGTYDDIVPYALATYFDYPEARLKSRKDYSLSAWEDLVYNELSTNGPVFYTAQANGLEGHAFVCDGYEGDGYFHFNWGWYGDSNGFFKLSALDVSQGFALNKLNWNHDIVTGIHRPDVAQPTGEPLHLTSRGLSTDDTKQFTRRSATDEYGPMEVFDMRKAALPRKTDMEFTLGVYQNGTLVEPLTDYVETQEGALNSSFTRNRKIRFGSMLPDGDYELRAISREKGTEEWQQDDWSDLHHIAFNISNKCLTPKTYVDGRQLVVHSVAYSGKRDGRYIYTLDVSNDGYQYDGSLFFMRYAEDSRAQETSFLMSPGEHKYARVALSREITGGDSLKVALDFMGGTMIFENKLDSLTPRLTATAQPVNVADGCILGGYLGIKATVSNTGERDYHGGIGCRFYSYPDNKLIAEMASDADIPAGLSTNGTYEFPIRPESFSKYTGKQYVLKLVGYGFRTDANGTWTDSQELYTSEPLTLKPGVVYYAGKDNIVGVAEATETVKVPNRANAVDLQYSLGEVKTIEPNDNPNCLYVTYWRDNQPETTDGINLVKTDKAESIKLVAGKGFYSPVDFTAATVEYTCNVKPDCWQTLTIPFDVDVQTLTADGIIVKEFVGEENGNVHFDDAQTVTGWKPLLVAGTEGERVYNATNVNFAEAQTGMTETDTYRFCMATTPVANNGNIYLLSADGKSFVKYAVYAQSFSRAESIYPEVKPFGAYFVEASDNDVPADVLNVVIEGSKPEFTAIGETTLNKGVSPVTSRYTITGCTAGATMHGVVIERHADGSVTKRIVK